MVSLKRQAYRKNRISGMDKYNAARAAGYSHYTAIKAGEVIEPKIDFTDVLIQAGATDKALADTLVEAMDAYKVISCNIMIDKDLNVKNKDANGETNDFIEVKDWQTRLAAVKQLCELRKLTNAKTNGSGPTMETFLIELLKVRAKELALGEGIRITHIESRELDEFVQK
jgi:hypothetical protein